MKSSLWPAPPSAQRDDRRATSPRNLFDRVGALPESPPCRRCNSGIADPATLDLQANAASTAEMSSSAALGDLVGAESASPPQFRHQEPAHEFSRRPILFAIARRSSPTAAGKFFHRAATPRWRRARSASARDRRSANRSAILPPTVPQARTESNRSVAHFRDVGIDRRLIPGRRAPAKRSRRFRNRRRTLNLAQLRDPADVNDLLQRRELFGDPKTRHRSSRQRSWRRDIAHKLVPANRSLAGAAKNAELSPTNRSVLSLSVRSASSRVTAFRLKLSSAPLQTAIAASTIGR